MLLSCMCVCQNQCAHKCLSIPFHLLFSSAISRAFVLRPKQVSDLSADQRGVRLDKHKRPGTSERIRWLLRLTLFLPASAGAAVVC
eukprot:COSAG03_NODE_1759_length_3565_cov_6.498557_2_plen_86_part_00